MASIDESFREVDWAMTGSRSTTTSSASLHVPARMPTPIPMRPATPYDTRGESPRVKPRWTQKKRIATPWGMRWTRSCRQLLPVLVFLIAASLAAFLLHRHTEWVMVTGEVEARHATISSPTAGILTPVSVRIGKLDRVRQGDVIARVESESSPAAQSQALRDLTRLHSQSSATQATEIRAPLSGCVTDVYLHPGQFVQSGQPILELVEEEASHIIAYIRQDQRVRPVRGMAVQVHLQSDPAHAYESYVETVGVQMVRLPDPMLRDHKTPEWGLPVRIAIPPTAGLRPGDSVNVVFKPDILPAQSPVQVPSTKTSPTPKRTLPLHLATAQPLQPTVGSFR